jgi:hypothetical protein
MTLYWKNWVRSCTAGIGFGTGIAILIAFLASHYAPLEIQHSWIYWTYYYSFLILAGLIQGLFIGISQINRLRLRYPRIRPSGWITNTVITNILIWLGIATLSLIFSDPIQTFWQTGYLYKFVLGLSLGFTSGILHGLFQYASMRKHAIHAYRWITSNILGWSLAGLLLSFALILSLAYMSRVITLLAGFLAVILMGITVAMVTGYYLVERLSPKLS